MTGKVQTLRLSGLDGCEAQQAVRMLLNDRTVPDLSRLIVLDDTAILLEHAAAFEHLLTSGRLSHLMCLAIGPAAHGDRTITLPGSIGAGQGSALLWVSDPLGVDWPLESSAVATIHPETALSGLHHLVEVLSAVEVFEQVREIVIKLPGGVASPGLRLDEASEMVSSFPYALAGAIRRLSQPGGTTSRLSRVDSLLERLEPELGGRAELAANGGLALTRVRCGAEAEGATTALDQVTNLGQVLGVSRPVIMAREQVVAAGEALAEFKAQVSGLLDYAHAPGGLSDRQRQRLRDAGVLLTSSGTSAEPRDARQAQPSPAPSVADAVSRAAVEAVGSGEPLPSLADRLALAERKLIPRGSRSYLPEADQCCPDTLIRRLLDPPPPPPPQPWLPLAGAVAAAVSALGGWVGMATGLLVAMLWTGIVALTVSSRACSSLGTSRRVLLVNFGVAVAGAGVGVAIGLMTRLPAEVSLTGLVFGVLIALVAAARSWRERSLEWSRMISAGQAAEAADALADMIVRVGCSEWSPDSSTVEAIARTKITVDAISDQLQDYANRVEAGGGAGSERQHARLSSSFEPTLRDLIAALLTAQPTRGHSDGQAAYRQVRARAEELVSQWTAITSERGPFARPPFATASDDENAHVDPDGLSAIVAAAAHDPGGVMWQLCAPADLAMLDTHGRKGAVAFAPRMTRHTLHSSLPTDTIWTSSGHYAGLLRLVPLRPGGVLLDWSASPELETDE
jgi:hypothetical protein